MSILDWWVAFSQDSTTVSPQSSETPVQQVLNMGEQIENFDVQHFIDVYVMPWGINIILAIVIYIIGKMVVKTLVGIFGKIMAKSKYDDMLVDFLKSIVNAFLMLFVIVASLDQLGVDTTSLVAILGAAGLAIGLSLQGSLQNFAAGVMLLVFRPFKAGDFVEAGGVSGSVINIGRYFARIVTSELVALLLKSSVKLVPFCSFFCVQNSARISSAAFTSESLSIVLY